MYANELEKLLSHNKEVFKRFQGFFARDQLPSTLLEGNFYIGNTE